MTIEPAIVRRVVIHGCSGSGKSTLALRLGEQLSLPVIELDALFHQPGWTPTPAPEFRSRVLDALAAAEQAAGGWIVDGNYGSKLQDLVDERAQLALWFDLPRRIVMARIIRRSLRRVLAREALWNGNRERWRNLVAWRPEDNIIRWAWTMHARYHRDLSAAAANPAEHIRWVRLGSQRDVERVLSGLSC